MSSNASLSLNLVHLARTLRLRSFSVWKMPPASLVAFRNRATISVFPLRKLLRTVTEVIGRELPMSARSNRILSPALRTRFTSSAVTTVASKFPDVRDCTRSRVLPARSTKTLLSSILQCFKAISTTSELTLPMDKTPIFLPIKSDGWAIREVVTKLNGF